MKSTRTALCAIAGGLAALGIVMMAAGFALGGFDPRVFSMHIDTRTNTIELGGVAVAHPEDIPVLSWFVESGNSIEYGSSDAPDKPAEPDAPANPAAPDAPAAPAPSAEADE